MKAVVQRVKRATLDVAGARISEISRGLVVFFGVEKEDVLESADYLVKKIAGLRIFEDENGKMNLSVKDICGEILFVSQFTLLGDCSHGFRPSFTLAEEPTRAKSIYDYATKKLREAGIPVKTGIFGADMQIDQHNDGPVTVLLERK